MFYDDICRKRCALLTLFRATLAFSIGFMLSQPAVADEEVVMPKTVFLVCDGAFLVEKETADDPVIDQFDGSLYISITYTDEAFSEIKIQPFERDERLRAQSFVPTKNNAKKTISAPATEQLEVVIEATQDEVMLHQKLSTGAFVRARIDEQPLVDTRMRVQSVDMTLNRFSGRMSVAWGDRQVRDFKPNGAIRATKVSYLEQKSFDAKCHTMKERLF